MNGQKVKCLVVIVNRDKGELVADICKQYQLYFTYGILALGTAGSDLLDYLGICLLYTSYPKLHLSVPPTGFPTSSCSSMYARFPFQFVSIP